MPIANALRWMPGMKSAFSGKNIPVRVLAILSTGETIVAPIEDVSRPIQLIKDALHSADLTDAATVGCLLQLCREAYDDPHLRTRWSGSSGLWQTVAGNNRLRLASGTTEGDALAKTLILACS